MITPVLVDYGCSAFKQGSSFVRRVDAVGGVLSQQIAYQFRQSISRLYVVGCPDVYVIGGKTHGEATLLQPFAPVLAARSFYRSFDNTPKTGHKLRCAASSGETTSAMPIILDQCVLSRLDGTAINQGMFGATSASILFLDLSLADNLTVAQRSESGGEIRVPLAETSSVRRCVSDNPRSKGSHVSFWETHAIPSQANPHGLTSIEVPREYRCHDLVAKRLYYPLPRELLRALGAAIGSNVDESLQRVELTLSRICADFTLCVGFLNGAPVIYPLFQRSGLSLARFDKESLEKLDWPLNPEQAENMLRFADDHHQQVFETAKSYVGWLLTNRQFLDEHDNLQANWHMQDQAADQTEAMDRFCQRWRLSALVAPYLPLPWLPDQPRLAPSTTAAPSENIASTFVLPDIWPTPSRDELRNLTESSLRGPDYPAHLKDWRSLADASNSAKNQLKRFARIFEVQHFYRVLHERYSSALNRRQAGRRPGGLLQRLIRHD